LFAVAKAVLFEVETLAECGVVEMKDGYQLLFTESFVKRVFGYP
jgi:hypothetical protein